MTIYDGTDTFKGNVVAGDKLDSTALWHGTTLPTNPTNEVPANGLFLKTDTNEIYENTGTLASPTWTKIIYGEPTTITSITNVAHSTTPGDYTGGATMSFDGRIEPTHTGYFVSNPNEIINVANMTDTNDGTYAEVSNNAPTPSQITIVSSGKIVEFDFGQIYTSRTMYYKVDQYHNGNSNGLYIEESSNGSTWGTVASNVNSSNNNWQSCADSSSTRTMRYIRIRANSTNGYVYGRIYEMNLEATSPIDDTTTSTADHGTSAFCNGVGVVVGTLAGSTMTLEGSTNGSTWTKLRTVLDSDMTSSTTNYIRFNPGTYRYFRCVYPNAGDCEVTDITRRVYANETDYQWTHEHINIDPDDSTLALDGT